MFKCGTHNWRLCLSHCVLPRNSRWKNESFISLSTTQASSARLRPLNRLRHKGARTSCCGETYFRLPESYRAAAVSPRAFRNWYSFQPCSHTRIFSLEAALALAKHNSLSIYRVCSSELCHELPRAKFFKHLVAS